MQCRSDRLKGDIAEWRGQYDIDFLVSLNCCKHVVCQSCADSLSDIVVVDYPIPIIGIKPKRNNLLDLAIRIKCLHAVNLVCDMSIHVYMVLAIGSVNTLYVATGPYQCADAFRI